eukprot:TRINITY_DN2499_c0_g2_i1.p1 TRINITY_DN2499_c0_g2~~TRINITY_DN2499_c0_g2_i1.p1  ORF type:complete len:135 (+),score=10.86 TRINITY_DN2499_c0_g2_i1:225-629(+)
MPNANCKKGSVDRSERRRVLSYSDIEYLCKHVKAKKGISWILSLRDERVAFSPVKRQRDARPPNFFDNDMNKWKQRLGAANKSRAEMMQMIKNNYSFADSLNNSAMSPFSTIDPILLKGNTSPVLLPCLHSTST